MFENPGDYPFTATLEAGFPKIREELLNLHKSNFIPWPDRALYGQGWEVFGLYAYRRRIDRNCELCPETARLVEQVPGLTTAGFSSLTPGTHIRPHVGYTNAVLRCHLGLIVPEGCRIRVGSETREWTEGKCLVFDDTQMHEVWHHGDRPRVVLILDFLRPDGDSSQVDSPPFLKAEIQRMTGSGAGTRPADQSKSGGQ